MNTLKKTLALVATLAMASTAFVGCGKDDSSSESSSKKDSSQAADPTDAPETPTDAPETPTAPPETPTDAPETPSGAANSTEVGEVKLNTGGDKFTIAAWNSDDAPALIEAWKAADPDKAAKADFLNMDCKGGEAADKYDKLFQGGDAPDLYFAEADWALRFINDDTKTAALEDLGFTDANFTDQFAYTQEIGRATKGKNAGKVVGTSWQAAAGGFAYRTDLAEQYLGVKTPEEMQAKIEGWDKFVDAATTVAEASDGKVALADSLGGMWQVFAANRTTPWVEDGIFVLDDSCKEFADIAKKLWDNGGVTHNGQWSDAWIPAGTSGACMGYFVSTWGFGEGAFFGQASAESRGKWNVCQGPDSYFWGGTWMVVNPGTDNAEEAQSFILNTTVKQDTMRDFAISKPEYVNNMSAMQDIIDKNENPNEFVTNNLNGQNYFAVLNEGVLGVDLKGLITPYDATIKGKFLDAVTEEYCKNGASWEDVEKKIYSDVAAAVEIE